MITSLSIARFVWRPFPWLFVVLLSCVIIAVVCHAFDKMAESEDNSEQSNADENEMINDEVAVFTRRYIKIWTGNRYKYLFLPFVLLFSCLIIFLVG